MVSFEKIPNENKLEIEQALEAEKQEFAVNFLEMSEHMAELGEIQIAEPNNKLKEEISDVIDFFRRDNGKNAKLVGYGLAIAFGKTAYDFLSFIDAVWNARLPIDMKAILETYFDNKGMIFGNLFIGAGSVATQASFNELKEVWSQHGGKIKDIGKSIKRGFSKLSQLAYGQI